MTQSLNEVPRRTTAKPVTAAIMTIVGSVVGLCCGAGAPIIAWLFSLPLAAVAVGYFCALALVVAGVTMLWRLPRLTPRRVGSHVGVIVVAALGMLLLILVGGMLPTGRGGGRYSLSIALAAPVWLPLISSIMSLSMKRTSALARKRWALGLCAAAVIVVLVGLVVPILRGFAVVVSH